MKHASSARKPSKAKARAKTKKRQPNPILDMLNSMDDDLIAMLRQVVQKEMGLGSELLDLQDPVDLFAEFLDNCAVGTFDDDRHAELLADLVSELGDLKIDLRAANGTACFVCLGA